MNRIARASAAARLREEFRAGIPSDDLNADVRSKRDAGGIAPLGLRARELNERLRRLQYGPLSRFLRSRVANLLDLARIAWFWTRIAPMARAKFGVPLATQLRHHFRLAFRKGIDPSIYYMAGFYRPGALGRVDQYLLRHEVKGLLLAFLHRLQPPAAERRINLGDKLQVAAWCVRANLPHPAPLMLIEDGHLVWQTGILLDLDQDLFVKPRMGRGARGVRMFRRIAAFHYLDENGRKLKLGELVSDLIREAGTRNLIVQPRLRNHPELADLATASLIVVRAVTCLNENLQPELVVAYLRILSKLEPDWPAKKPPIEYGAAVELDTGRLGRLIGDTPQCLEDWHDRHPVTGSEITGRVLPCWDRLAKLAQRAHQVFNDRVVIGWDIAITPSGPVLLEGNSYPDMHFPQRIYQRGYGEMRIGQLLQHHLNRVDALLDSKRIRRR